MAATTAGAVLLCFFTLPLDLLALVLARSYYGNSLALRAIEAACLLDGFILVSSIVLTTVSRLRGPPAVIIHLTAAPFHVFAADVNLPLI